MSTRTKAHGVAAAIAAIAVAMSTTVQASADPTPAPVDPAAPAASPTSAPPASPTPIPSSIKVPDPQGPGCDAYRTAVPTGVGSISAMALQSGSEAIASNPDLSTFSAAISGKLNPDINIVSVLDGGPYVVFAPTDAAFAKLDAATLETLKTDPAVLLPTLFYHMVLGFLGPNDVQGTMPTQDGRSVVVTGKGGDIQVNDNRVVCAYTARGAYIYMIDEVLTPPTPAAEAAASTTPTSVATETPAPETSGAETPGAETPGAETPGPETPAAETPAAETSGAGPTSAAATPEATVSGTATPTTTAARPAA